MKYVTQDDFNKAMAAKMKLINELSYKIGTLDSRIDGLIELFNSNAKKTAVKKTKSKAKKGK